MVYFVFKHTGQSDLYGEAFINGCCSVNLLFVHYNSLSCWNVWLLMMLCIQAMEGVSCNWCVRDKTFKANFLIGTGTNGMPKTKLSKVSMF